MADTEDRVARLEELVHEGEKWRAAHDGRINELWRQQHQTNTSILEKIAGISGRLFAVEKRVVWLSALSAAAGGAVGGLI